MIFILINTIVITTNIVIIVIIIIIISMKEMKEVFLDRTRRRGIINGMMMRITGIRRGRGRGRGIRGMVHHVVVIIIIIVMKVRREERGGIERRVIGDERG